MCVWVFLLNPSMQKCLARQNNSTRLGWSLQRAQQNEGGLTMTVTQAVMCREENRKDLGRAIYYLILDGSTSLQPEVKPGFFFFFNLFY